MENIKNKTEIYLFKLTIKNRLKKKKPSRVQKIYPKRVEGEYRKLLRKTFRELGDYAVQRVNVHFDSADTDLANDLEEWTNEHVSKSSIINYRLQNIADKLRDLDADQWKRTVDKTFGVNFDLSRSWWEETKKNWVERNINLIKSSSRTQAQAISNLAIRAVENGWSTNQLAKEIMKVNSDYTLKKAKLIARDQTGSLNAEFEKKQSEEIGIDCYKWSTSLDERVRGNPNGKYPNAVPSHYIMEGLLCKWSDPTVVSYDEGKTWVPRTDLMPKEHPGEPINCRCVSLEWLPDLLGESSEKTSINPLQVEETKPEEIPSIPAPVELVNVTANFKIPLTEIKAIENKLNKAIEKCKFSKETEKTLKNCFENSTPLVKLAQGKALKNTGYNIIKDTSRNKTSYVVKNTVYFNEKNMSSTTLRHELGHLTDNQMNKKIKIFKDTIMEQDYEVPRSFWDEKFKENFDKELNAFIKKMKKTAKEKYEKKEGVFENMYTLYTVTPKEQLEKYLRSIYKLEDHTAGIQDMLDAKGYNMYYGHGKNYWNRGKNIPELKGMSRYNEAWAELMEAMGSEKSIFDFYREIFPDTMDYLEKVLLEYLKKK